MPKNAFRWIAGLTLSLVLGLAQAQTQYTTDDADEDPPDRAARLSYLSGDVSMQPVGEDDWAPALLNRPLTTGDKLWTERDARAEIEVGPAEVRLDGRTGFSFLNVDDDTIQMRMTAGVIYVNVRALEGNDHIEIDTPHIALTVLRPGNYRVEVDDDGDATVVKISEGEAEAQGPGQNVVVHAQQIVTFRGEDPLVADWSTLGSPDEFDRWNFERDRRGERVASSRTAEYVSPDVTGYEDLDEYGRWSSEPEYGYVWTPSRVAVDWSPYRFGRWVWISPWGWTWIDDAPWGYAPFHYGRWAHVRDRWCWVPGPRHVRAVYAPALVGWVGAPGVNVSVSFGRGVGWFPLGPREVYVPGRRFSHRYVERVNVSNTVIVNRTYLDEVYRNRGRNVDYRNRHAPNGFTAVPRDVFVRGGRTADARQRVDERELARADVTTAPQLAPTREGRLGTLPRGNVRPPPRDVVDRQVIVRREPPPAASRFARDGSWRAERPTRVVPDGSSQPSAPIARDPRVAPMPRDDRPPKARDERGDDRSFQRETRQTTEPSTAPPRWRRDTQERDQTQREQIQRDQMQRDQAQRDQQQRDETQREQSRREQWQREQMQRDQLQREQSRRDQQQRDAQQQQQERERSQREQNAERERVQQLLRRQPPERPAREERPQPPPPPPAPREERQRPARPDPAPQWNPRAPRRDADDPKPNRE